MLNWLYEAPLWLPAGLMLIGLAVGFIGLRGGRDPVRNVGAAIFGSGIAILIISLIVTTPVEQVRRNTQALVGGVVARDWPAVTGLVDPRARFSFVSGRDGVMAVIKAATEKAGIGSATVLGMQTTADPDVITVNLDVVSVQEVTGGRPLRSGWQLDWAREGDSWLLSTLTPVSAGNMDRAQIEKWLPRAN